MKTGETGNKGGQVEGTGAAWLRVTLSDAERTLDSIEAERCENLAVMLINDYAPRDISAERATARIIERLTDAGFAVSEQYSADILSRLNVIRS